MPRKPPPLWKHQRRTVSLYKKTPRIFDTSDPGTGKTRSHLHAFNERRENGGKCALVVCPKSLMESAWVEDIHQYFPHLRTAVAYAGAREEAFVQDADIYIINTDGVKWLVDKPKKFFQRFDTIIVDESHYFKHHTSQRSKALIQIKDYFDYRIMMTGTPFSGSIMEVWNQLLFLDDGERLGTSYYRLRSVLCEPKKLGPITIWEDKEASEEAVSMMIADISIRHEFDKCMDIPPNHQYQVPFTLSKKVQRMYNELRDMTLLKLEKEILTPANAAVLHNKLLQVASGAVYTGEKKYEVLSKERYDLIADLVEQRQHSLVFFLWTHQRNILSEILKKRGVEHEIFDGNVSDRERARIVKAYQAGFYQTLLLHPQTGAHGLTLTRGTATIWSSPSPRADLVKQAKHRILRGGQTQVTETLHVTARNTYEGRVYNKMQSRTNRIHNLLDLLQNGE